jgi:hypothetical protein
LRNLRLLLLLLRLLLLLLRLLLLLLLLLLTNLGVSDHTLSLPAALLLI